jgi:hypothetical protein
MCRISGYVLYLNWILSGGLVCIVYNVQSTGCPLGRLKRYNVTTLSTYPTHIWTEGPRLPGRTTVKIVARKEVQEGCVEMQGMHNIKKDAEWRIVEAETKGQEISLKDTKVNSAVLIVSFPTLLSVYPLSLHQENPKKKLICLCWLIDLMHLIKCVKLRVLSFN